MHYLPFALTGLQRRDHFPDIIHRKHVDSGIVHRVLFPRFPAVAHLSGLDASPDVKSSAQKAHAAHLFTRRLPESKAFRRCVALRRWDWSEARSQHGIRRGNEQRPRFPHCLLAEASGGSRVRSPPAPVEAPRFERVH